MEAIGALFFLVCLVALIHGAIRTYQRNWIAALLLMLFFPGIWIIWALVELFIPRDNPRIHNVSGSVNDALASNRRKE